MATDKKTPRKYQKPTILKKEKSRVSNSVCGWYTQCGIQVQSRS